MRKNGIAVWSATPEDQTPQFFELIKRAEANDPHVELFMLQVADNPYYSDEAKEVMYQNLKAQGEAVLQVKWYGKPAIRGLAVYPGYDQKVHALSHSRFQRTGCELQPLTLEHNTQQQCLAL